VYTILFHFFVHLNFFNHFQVLDDEGYLSIVGRIKDTIIRGGENIAPREIEDVLFTHPFIENASVVAVPDERYGDEVNIVCVS